MVGPGIEVGRARKRYQLGGGRTVDALHDLDLKLAPGGFAVVMGPNGSGKSTLLRAIDGSLELDAGTVRLSPAASSPTRPQIVHVSQDPLARSFSFLTLAEHFLLSELVGRPARWLARGVTATRRKNYAESLSDYGRDDLIPYLDRPVKELSGGMRQAASLLTAVVSASERPETWPGVLLLDEPTAALDVKNAGACLELVGRLHEEGATVLLVTHDPLLASGIGETLLLMKHGRVWRRFAGAEKRALTHGDLARVFAELQIEISEPREDRAGSDDRC